MNHIRYKNHNKKNNNNNNNNNSIKVKKPLQMSVLD